MTAERARYAIDAFDDVGLADLLRIPTFAGIDRADIDVAIGEYSHFVDEVIAPTDRASDQIGTRFDAASGQVVTPAGFVDAYRRLVDTGWLQVAHIDELMHVVPVSPAGSGGRGWKLAVADPAQSLALLRQAAAAGHGKVPVTSDRFSNFGTIASLLADKSIVAHNTAAAARIDAALKGVMSQAGLTSADVIRVPVIFRLDINTEEDPDPTPQVPSRLTAMLPNAIMMSLFLAAASVISSFGTRRRPSCVSLSTVNITSPMLRSR